METPRLSRPLESLSRLPKCEAWAQAAAEQVQEFSKGAGADRTEPMCVYVCMYMYIYMCSTHLLLLFVYLCISVSISTYVSIFMSAYLGRCVCTRLQGDRGFGAGTSFEFQALRVQVRI